MASDAKIIVHLATLVKNNCSINFCVAAENGELRKKVNAINVKTFEALSSKKRLQEKISALTKERSSLIAKCEELELGVRCIPGLGGEAKSLRAWVAEIAKASKRKAPEIWSRCKTAEMEVVAE